MTNINNVPASIQSINDFLLSQNGKFTKVVTSRPVKMKKSSHLYGLVKKISEMVLQADVNYENKKSTKEAREDGRQKRGLHPSDERKSPVLIYNHNTHKYRFGFGVVKTLKASSRFFIGNKEVTKEEIERDMLASEKGSKDRIDWITLNPDNILELGGYKIK